MVNTATVLLTGSWATASLEERKSKHCSEVAWEMNSGKAHFLMAVKPLCYSELNYPRGPHSTEILYLNQDFRGTEFMAGLTHFRFIREANEFFTSAWQTHTSTQLWSGTSLFHKLCHSNHKLGCLTCLFWKYCHSCKICNSSYFITPDCSTFAGIIDYEGS